MITLENVSLNYPISNKNLSVRKNIIGGIFGSNVRNDYIEALKKINLKIDKGVYGLSGANGSGKTLLMRVAHGLIGPTHGEVSWADKTKLQYSVRQTMVFQKPIMLKRTVRENLLFTLSTIEKNIVSKEQLVEKALSEINLSKKANVYAPKLSQGEQQKLAIIRACLLKPEVLFLDEPTSNIDPY